MGFLFAKCMDGGSFDKQFEETECGYPERLASKRSDLVAVEESFAPMTCPKNLRKSWKRCIL